MSNGILHRHEVEALCTTAEADLLEGETATALATAILITDAIADGRADQPTDQARRLNRLLRTWREHNVEGT